MIGVFDSGYGGLTILQELVRAFPARSFIYLGDNARAPYGSLPQNTIYEYTKQGVEFLFSHGCNLVLLACNTASAVALRRLQQEFLPRAYPHKRILGIVVPTIEQITGTQWSDDAQNHTPRYSTIGILATPQTVQSQSYEKEINKRAPSIIVVSQPCPQLVPLIEQHADESIIQTEVQHCLDQLFQKNNALDALILGCTHYQLIKHLFPPTIPLIEQPTIVAERLKWYVQHHPESDNENSPAHHIFYTTEDANLVSRNAQNFFENTIQFQQTLLL
ncbi:MAG TPA: glutamate racemase [Patescibacteria group bacterium]|nr:glutamate racemase [Patescibacteria group bacterium]